MSQNSDTFDSGLQMEVHKMAEADNSSVQQKFDAIRDYIGRKGI